MGRVWLFGVNAADGGESLIVDNSVSSGTGLECLLQWCDTARSLDIVTGSFEIAALLALDGKWQRLERIRVLMGEDASMQTRAAFADALARRVACIDDDLEIEKCLNPFLDGVADIVDAIAAGRIEFRVYRRDKFSAKAYIAQAKSDTPEVGTLIGSSDFTRSGLAHAFELNLQTRNGREVAQLRKWFETHWSAAEDVSADLSSAVRRHISEFTPFDVYAKALHEYFRRKELIAGEWDMSRSRMFRHLDRYQHEAYWSLMKIARRYGGAFLCDGVGLGKTFVGLMLIERLVQHEDKRVTLFAPKAARDSVWEPHLRKWLPHIGGVGDGEDFSSLSMFSHNDLSRGGGFTDRFRRVTELADAVIVDEAHHFRNRGSRSKSTEGSGSRYWRLYDILDSSIRPKLVFLLTATPVNNSLADFRHMAELFTRGDDAFFSRNLGVANLSGHFNAMENALRSTGSAFSDGMTPAASEALAADEVFAALVVQRSRSYAKKSQIHQQGEAAVFPVRERPRVVGYSIRSSYREVLDMLVEAFSRNGLLFSLAMYHPLAYYIGSGDVNAVEENRQRQVAGLLRVMLLKRFESSVYAFEKSLQRLIRKLLSFAEMHSEPGPEQERCMTWKRRHAFVLGFYGHDDDRGNVNGYEDDDVMPTELLEEVPELPREDYDMAAILDGTFDDLDLITGFLHAVSGLDSHDDDKACQLVNLLRSEEMAGHKVLVFTEFADTARYVESRLRSEGVGGVARIDGGSAVDRAEMIRRFSPYYNGSSSAQLAREGLMEIWVLISTDVLSEGLNLQDATRLVNYDLHWNPVRLMQRIGRVDRRMSSEAEQRLVADHPGAAAERGVVRFWNFLPPDELDRMLDLYERVADKALLISRTLGIEGRKLLHPDDAYHPLREFNAACEGTCTDQEDLLLEYQKLLEQHPGLADRLDTVPEAVFSGRRRPAGGVRGVFFCYSLPAFDTLIGEFTLEAGPNRWYLYNIDDGTIVESPGGIVDSIRSDSCIRTLRTMDSASFAEIRGKVHRRIRDSYLKRVNAPLNAPEPRLHCWMEVV